MKIVSQLDQHGYFIGAVQADPSPLEPGVYLLPGGAIDQSPPEVPQGKVALWQGDQWAFVSRPGPAEEETPPVDGVPQVVSRFQARAALHLSGLLEPVETLMASPEVDPLQRLAWTDAQEFRRSSPTLQAAAQALSLTEQQLDELFTLAAAQEA